MIKQTIVDEPEDFYELSEVHQYFPIYYAFVKEVKPHYFETVHKMAVCREFFNDVAWYRWLDGNGHERYQQYGFYIDRDRFPDLNKRTHLHVYYQLDDAEKACFKANSQLLWDLYLSNTKMKNIMVDTTPDDGIVVKIPVSWFKTTYHSSFISLFLKLMCLRQSNTACTKRSAVVDFLKECQAHLPSSCNEVKLLEKTSVDQMVDTLFGLPMNYDSWPNGYSPFEDWDEYDEDYDEDGDYIENEPGLNVDQMHAVGLFDLMVLIKNNILSEDNQIHKHLKKAINDKEATPA